MLSECNFLLALKGFRLRTWAKGPPMLVIVAVCRPLHSSSWETSEKWVSITPTPPSPGIWDILSQSFISGRPSKLSFCIFFAEDRNPSAIIMRAWHPGRAISSSDVSGKRQSRAVSACWANSS